MTRTAWPSSWTARASAVTTSPMPPTCARARASSGTNACHARDVESQIVASPPHSMRSASEVCKRCAPAFQHSGATQCVCGSLGGRAALAADQPAAPVARPFTPSPPLARRRQHPGEKQMQPRGARRARRPAGAARLGDGRHLDRHVHDVQRPRRHGAASHWHVVVQAIVGVVEAAVRVAGVREHHVHHPGVARNLRGARAPLRGPRRAGASKEPAEQGCWCCARCSPGTCARRPTTCMGPRACITMSASS